MPCFEGYQKMKNYLSEVVGLKFYEDAFFHPYPTDCVEGPSKSKLLSHKFKDLHPAPLHLPPN